MPDSPSPDLPDTDERPALSALIGQLASDSTDFARAEIAYLRAQAGERASFALPGLIMIGVAIALGFGAIVALVVGAMMLVATVMPPVWAILLVTTVALLTTVLLARLGIARLRGSLKPREDR